MHHQKYFGPKPPNKYLFLVIFGLTIIGIIILWGYVVWLINNPIALDNFLN
jgi:hypothetical protein